MQKMEIITASGKSTTVPSGLNQIKIIQAGSTVKISVAKEMISGSQKEGNNLILVAKNGSKITIEDFFKTEGTLKNKLLFDDNGKTYEAKYNAEHFAGLSFFPVKQTTNDNADNGEMSTAVWLVPLLAVAAAGIGIAIYNSNDDGSSHHNNPDNNKEKQALSDAQKNVVIKDSSLVNAQKKLADAVKTMQANPSAATIKAVEEAAAAVKSAMEALNKANAVLKNAIDAAKAKGIDTSAAEKIQKQANEDATSAKSAIDKVAELVKTALALTDESAKAVAEQVKLEFKSASAAAAAANKQPGQQAIDTAKAKVTAADAALVKLNAQIEQLTGLIAKAKDQGFNVDNATARLKALQEQQVAFSKESKALADSVAQAEQSLKDLDTARKAVDAASEAVKLAAEQKALAAKKLTEALALKAEVLKNNQLERVDEVNKAIAEANKSLEAARQAVEAANSAVTKANGDIDKINSAVDPSVKPEKVPSVEPSDQQPIDKGLQIDDNKTFIESVSAFVKSLVDSVNEVWQTIAESKSLAFLNKTVSEISSAIKTVGGVLGEKVVSAVKAIKAIEKALGEILINKPFDFFKDVIEITWQKVTQAVSETFSTLKTGFDAVISGISKAITDSLKDMSLTDWINPAKWVSLVKNVIVDSISNVVKGITDVLKTIPTKIIDFLADAISKYAGAFADKVKAEFNVVKETISEVVKTLFEGFIKNPIEKLLSPILEKVTEFLSNPVESLQKLVSGIVDLAKDALNIIKGIIELPGKWVTDSFQLIKDIYNAFKGDSVKNGDGSELQKLIEKLVSDAPSDKANIVNSLLKSSSDSGDINLSKLVPEAPATKVQSAAEATSSVANYHSTSAMDDMHSSLPVAA